MVVKDQNGEHRKRRYGKHVIFYAVWLHGGLYWFAYLGVAPIPLEVAQSRAEWVVIHAFAYLLVTPLWHFITRRRH